MSLLLPLNNDKVDGTSVFGIDERSASSQTISRGSAFSSGTSISVDPNAKRVVFADVTTSANVTLSGLQNFDGITGATGLVVAVRNQTDPAENGPYIMAGGAWIRTGDALDLRTSIRIGQGTLNAGTELVLTNSTIPVLGTDDVNLTFDLVGAGTSGYVARFSAPGKLTTGLIQDDASTIRIGTALTTGLVNIVTNATNGTALYIKNSATTGTGVSIYAEAANSGGFAIEAVGSNGAGGVYAHPAGGGTALYGVGTTGRAGFMFRNNAGGTTPVFEVVQDNATDTWMAMYIQQDGSGAGAYLEMNGSGTGLAIDQSGSGKGVDIAIAGTGTAFNLVQSGGGRGGYVSRNNSSATEAVWEIEQLHASDVENTLVLSNAGTSSGAGALRASTTGGGVAVFAGANTHSAFYGYRNSGSTSSPLAQLWDDHASSTQTVLYVRGDGTGRLLELFNSSTERLAVTSSGYVTINAASGGTALLVDSADTSGTIAVLHLRQQQSWGIGFYDVYSGGNSGHSFQHITRRGRGSIDSPADVQSGDQIGAYLFRPRANATFSNATGFLAYVDGSVSGTTCPTRLEIHVRATTTMAEAARFDSAGNFAIGTGATATARIQAQISSGTIHGLVVNQQGAADLVQFQDGGTTVWKIKDGGAVDQEVGEEKPYDSFSATTTLSAAHWHVHMDTSGGARTFNLPAGSGAVERVYFIENTGGAALTLARNGTDTINGAGANITINSGEFYFVHATSTTNWRAIRIA